MVLLKSINPLMATPFELKLESSRMIRFIAPKAIQMNRATNGLLDKGKGTRKNSVYDVPSTEEEWEGVGVISQYLDSLIEIERETDFFDQKSVLEIGFASGLPSVFAMDNGASEVAIHCQSKEEMDCFVRPTLSRNQIPKNKCKFSYGDIQDLRKAIGGKKFDIVIALEPLRYLKYGLEDLHQALLLALNPDGMCLLASKAHDFHHETSLLAFKEIIQRFHQFDWLERWESESTNILQWKIIQLTRSIY